MGNSIFNFINNANSVNKGAAQLAQIKNMLSGNNPETVAMNLMQKNPQFKSFVEQCRGKSINEICSMYGLDLETVKSVLSK